MKLRLNGLVAAVHTPFNADGALELRTVEKQADHLVTHRITSAFVSGTTGESHSLTLEERRQLTQRWFEVTRGTPLGVIVHVGSNCLSDARALAAQAGALGTQAISAMPPSYFRPRDLAGLVDWCAAIAAEAPNTPFYYYHIPVLSGVNFSMPEFLAQGRSRIPTLTGIKFTDSDLMTYQLCLRAEGGMFDVPYGTDEYLLAALALGARGAVGSTYNFAAPIYRRLLAAFARGDLDAARQEQFQSVQLIRLLAGYGYMGAAKAVMGMLGVEVGPARPPNARLTGEQAAQLRRDLEAMGFFDWCRPSND